jgi:glycine hydroxymethyltransferase
VNFVEQEDPAIWSSIAAEQTRQAEGLEMIASENFTSPAIMQAVGSVLTNKYAEGYPGRRYYGGCEYVDTIEDLARDRAKQLFGAEHANVQPHSGSQANSAVYLAAIKPGDTVLAFDLSHGGHLTHGMRLNSSGILYRFVHYGVRQDDHLLDFDQIVRLAREHKPKLIVAGASAYPREIPHERFAEIANEVGAKLLVDMAHYAGLVAAGVHNSPVPYADFVTSTTHKTLRGPRGGIAMCRAEHAKDLDRAVFPGTQGGPLMHVVAGKAVAFAEALRPEFKEYAEQVVANARSLAQSLAAGGVKLVSGGTDNHLMLVDVTPLDLGGKLAEESLDRCGITCNKNMIPYDARKPVDPSGIRLGTPALTTRGMGVDEMQQVATWILRVLKSPEDKQVLESTRREVAELAEQYPVPAARMDQVVAG